MKSINENTNVRRGLSKPLRQCYTYSCSSRINFRLVVEVVIARRIIPNRLPIVRAKITGWKNLTMMKIAPASLTPDVNVIKLPLSRKMMKIASDMRSKPVIANPSDIDISDRVSTLLVLDLT